jgi:hypothetical protein
MGRRVVPTDLGLAVEPLSAGYPLRLLEHTVELCDAAGAPLSPGVPPRARDADRYHGRQRHDAARLLYDLIAEPAHAEPASAHKFCLVLQWMRCPGGGGG